jgi:hypothetical protein
MGRKGTYADEAFGRENYDAQDDGEFIRGLVFVIMPFTGQAHIESYAAIQQECEKLGLRAVRADEAVGSKVVLADITAMIEDAEFIICDLSDERPNVYYELGYAHGVGNQAAEILLIAKADTSLHFDIAPIRVRFYSSLEELRLLVGTQLAAMIRTTRR